QRGEYAEAEAERVAVDGGGGVKAPLPPISDHLDVVGEQDAFVDPELGGGSQILEELVRGFLVGADEGAGDALAGVRVDPAGASTDPGGAVFKIGGDPHPDRWHRERRGGFRRAHRYRGMRATVRPVRCGTSSHRRYG